MTREEKLELYWRAKEAYYNGEEIMSDLEFDQLEKELGLENKAAVGARHNPSYTIQHPFVMGSLSKVQIHKDNEGNIDWDKYAAEIAKYIFKNNAKMVLASPKYDGCSFEAVIKDRKIESISTRGDGEYGKDIKKHIEAKVQPNVDVLNKKIKFDYTLRGEVLVDKEIFSKLYSEFTNPRSFVSGVLNRDYSEDEEFQEMLANLSIVIYDIRTNENGTWVDQDWDKYNYPDKPQYSLIVDDKNLKGPGLGYIYERFNEYRHETCKFALDGIVLKPTQEYRENNLTEHRPKDCVAVKFVPMLEETEVVNITWNLGKTFEFIPIIWVKPVEMDGRMVQKCSGHNLGYLREKGITVGAKIIMSLAGDIIPFMYKVTQENKDGDIPMPTEYGYAEDGIHLMAVMNDEDRTRMQFLASSSSLNIPNIGTQTAKDIFEYVKSLSNDSAVNEFFGETKKELPFNILLLTPDDIYFGAGSGKAGNNAKKAFKDVLDKLTLVDIIKSCSFNLCGGKVAEQCANYLINGEADWSHLATEGYSWVFDNNSQQMQTINKIMEHFGKTFDDFKERLEEAKETASNQIPIIMTGEPTTCGSKGEFLRLHPEYRNTGSWKEVQIVFTNSMESNTGKMKKAREKGIEIRLY